MKRKTGICIIMLLFAAALLLQGCGSQNEQETKKRETENTETEQADEEETEASEDVDASGQPEASKTSGIAVPSVSGALHVEGTALVDSSGTPVQLKGISTHGLSWYPGYVNQDCFRQLRNEWNANVIRLAMYTAESGGYCTDGNKEDLKNIIRRGVQYATDQDMYVIIDWHILSDNDPNLYLEEAKLFFDEVSKEYAQADNVLYEICNEPNGNTGWQDVKKYAEEVIPVIRANDPDGVIIVGTPNWSQYVDQAAADPITGYDNIMYTLHFYAATHKEDLRNKMVQAVEAGLPVFVTEYGICDASGNGAIDLEQADQWAETMDQYGISYVAWNLSNKDESSAILKSTCSKTSGFEESDLSECGQWLYKMLTGGKSLSSSQNNAGQSSQSSGNSDGMVFESGGMEVSAQLKNSWEADGQPVYQYDLTLKNISGSACTNWAIDVSFDGEISLQDGWNGEYQAQGKQLHITSKDYNGAVAAGDSVKDVGFIVKGGKLTAE